jgi:VanZ family protein
MAVIFLLSATPAQELPDFGLVDLLIKKGGHMVGYGLLSLTFLRGLGSTRSPIAALLLTGLYAASDELHQSFVPGRGSTVIDVGIDLVGASIALGIAQVVPAIRRAIFTGLNNTAHPK